MNDNENVVDTKDEQLDPVDVPDSWWLVRGSSGKGSVSTTLLLVSFFLTAASYVLNMFNLPLVKGFDVTATGVFFTPIVALYFARRHTESKEA